MKNGLFLRPDGAVVFVATGERNPGTSGLYRSGDGGRTRERQDLPRLPGFAGCSMNVKTVHFAGTSQGLLLPLFQGRTPSLVAYLRTP